MVVEVNELVACICEGAFEEAVMEILLENDLLVFNKSNLLDDRLIRCRKASNFEEEYLQVDYGRPITVLRILDSRREKFKLSPAYEHKVEVINIVTAPEIEMLVILNEGKFSQYKHSRMKPSVFCKKELNLKNVKSKTFVISYFNDPSRLVAVLKEYKRISSLPEGETTIADLLK